MRKLASTSCSVPPLAPGQVCEQILTHGAVLSILDAHLPIQSLLEQIDVLNQGGEDLCCEDLHIAEVTVVNVLAILQADSRWRHELVVFQPNLHAICNEHSISIQLQHNQCPDARQLQRSSSRFE